MKRMLLVVAAALMFLNTLVVPTVAQCRRHAQLQRSLQAVVLECRYENRTRLAVAVVACSKSRYSAALRLCCSRIHFFGTISGSRRNILQAVLAVLFWRRGIHRQFPVFFAYLVFEAIEQFTLYGMDILPLGQREDLVVRLLYWIGC